LSQTPLLTNDSHRLGHLHRYCY